MHQTKKGNQWYFGMKLHIGVDSESSIVHSLHTTAANVSDVTEGDHLLHRNDRGWGCYSRTRSGSHCCWDWRTW